MNETPAATHRTHAGCGHLCLTCGAQAAVRAVTSDVVWQVLSVVALCAVVIASSLGVVSVAHLAAKELAARQKPVPPPDVQQRWSDGAPLQYVNAIAHVRSTFTLTADEIGRVEFDVPQGMLCVVTSRGGATTTIYMSDVGRRRTVWGAEHGSVIHVGCW